MLVINMFAQKTNIYLNKKTISNPHSDPLSEMIRFKGWLL